MINDQELRVFIDRQRIAGRIHQLAAAINADYRGESVLLLPLLDGCFCFIADLVRELTLPDVRVHFAKAQSYVGTTSTGDVALTNVPDVANQHVIVVDDILDTGHTLATVLAAVKPQIPLSLRTCVLLDKPARRAVAVHADYIGFSISDQFVVGYGLDWDGRYRHLPDICVVK